MEESMKRMQEEGRRKLKELADKKSAKYVVGELKFRRLKKALLTTKLVAVMLTSGLAGAGIHEALTPENNQSSIYSTIEATRDLTSAQDEVILSYVNDSFNSYSKYVEPAMDSNDQIEAMHSTYYIPVMKAYYNYEETNDQKYYDEFKKCAREYEDRIGVVSPSFTFSKSIYKYAKSIDGEVCVPYTGIIDDSTIPENAHVIDRVVYVPVRDLKQEDEKKLGNE